MIRAISYAFIALLALPTQAFAWGQAGHRIVASIAERFLGGDAARQVRELLAADGINRAGRPDGMGYGCAIDVGDRGSRDCAARRLRRIAESRLARDWAGVPGARRADDRAPTCARWRPPGGGAERSARA